MSYVKNLRWWIAGLLALATALNYLDRQSFPVVVGEIKKEIPLTNDQYGKLTSLFLLAYAIMYAGGGRIMDWLGTRLGYAVMIVWWSASAGIHPYSCRRKAHRASGPLRSVAQIFDLQVCATGAVNTSPNMPNAGRAVVMRPDERAHLVTTTGNLFPCQPRLPASIAR